MIDLEFVRRTADGSLGTVSVGSLGLVAEGLAEDSILAVLVYEDLVLAPVLTAWRSGGASLLAEGPVAADDTTAD